MLYHDAYINMKKHIKLGLIGNIRYIYSNRLSLGKLRKEEDVLWSFAPHDISMILDLVREKLISLLKHLVEVILIKKLKIHQLRY